MTTPPPPDVAAQIADVETALAEATPGPWREDPFEFGAEIHAGDDGLIAATWAGADAAAIVAAVNAAPLLIAEVRRLREQEARVRAAVDEWRRNATDGPVTLYRQAVVNVLTDALDGGAA